MNLKKASSLLVSNLTKSEEFPTLAQKIFIKSLTKKLNFTSKQMQSAVVELYWSFSTQAELCLKPTKLKFFSTLITAATTYQISMASYSKITYTL